MNALAAQVVVKFDVASKLLAQMGKATRAKAEASKPLTES